MQQQNDPLSVVPTVIETVGDYMAKPTGTSGIHRANDALVSLSIVSLVLGGLVWLFQGKVFADFGGIFTAETVDLSALQIPLLLSGVAFAVLAVITWLISKRGRFVKHDAKAALKKGVMAVMIQQPRFGIASSTPLASVALNCEYLGKGTGVQGLQCWNGRVPFLQKDFAGVHPAQLGCFDYDVVDGRLYAFLTSEAKQGYRDYMMKGDSHE